MPGVVRKLNVDLTIADDAAVVRKVGDRTNPSDIGKQLTLAKVVSLVVVTRDFACKIVGLLPNIALGDRAPV